MRPFLAAHIFLLLLTTLPAVFASDNTPDREKISNDGFTVKEMPKDFMPRYRHWELLGLLGRGAAGAVFLGWNKTTYGAVKLSSKEVNSQKEWEKEVENTKKIKSKYAMKLYEVFPPDSDPKYFIHVSEAFAGQLLDLYFVEPLPEGADQRILWQLAKGLQDIKKSGYAHRDIKPKNIMLQVLPDKTAIPKYIDFGICEPLKTKNPPSIGTKEYMPVEMNSCSEKKTCPGLDTHKQDVFSLGLVFSQILSSQQMTPRVPGDELYRAVNWESPLLNKLSPEKLTVLRGMLDPNPKKRWTIDMVLHDPWISAGANKPNVKWSKRDE